MGNITINQDSLRTSREYKRHRVEQGSNIYRILPPFGDVDTHNNYPFKRWAVAWLINPETNKKTPFSSPFSIGDKDCPIHEYSTALKDHIETLKGKMKAKGWSDAKIKDKLKGLNEVQWNTRLSYSYAYNACDKSGNVGILELKTTAHKQMTKRFKEYITDYNQDPTSLNSNLREDSGVWMNILREGEGKNTTYSVEFNNVKRKDKETGEVTLTVDRSPLPEAVSENFDDLGYDLFAIYRQKSYDDLREILMYNLSLFAKEIPEAILPGYEEALSLGKSGSVVQAVEDEVEEETVIPVKKASKKIVTQFDDDDEDEDEVVASKPAKGGDMDDLMAFADSILED